MRTGTQATALRAAATADLPQGEPPEAEGTLSPRQRQILELLRQGKANKEIATQLGIGVGTVKQHVVALFKKLNVSNRAMAVSRGMAMDPPARSDAAALELAPGCVLERRLSVVLTLDAGSVAADGPAASAPRARLLRRSAAAVAQDYDAVLVTRGDEAVDLVFGVQRIREDDARRALRAARDLIRDVDRQDAGLAAQVRGALTAGLSMTSMTPTGGWTGELLASAALGQARDLAAGAPTGDLLIGATALDLLDGTRQPGASAPGRVRLCDLNRSLHRHRVTPGQVFGRAAETRILEDAVAALGHGQGGLLVLSGDAGMGKTMLADAAAAMARSAHLPAASWTVLPPDLPGAEAGVLVAANGFEHPARAVTAPSGGVLIIDDSHHLAPQAVQALAGAWRDGGRNSLIVLAGRPSPAVAALSEEATIVRVAHLDGPSLRAMMDAFGLRADAAVGVLELAGGVPMFAVELARAAQAGQPLVPPPPALMAVIQGRIEQLRLDRRVLARVCRVAHGVAMAEATAGLSADEAEAAVARVLAAGVVRRDEDHLRVPHPLLRAVLDAALVE